MDLNIFIRVSGIAIARAMIEMFDNEVSFRIALIEIPRARVMTMKNQRRIIVFHLYFISMKIRAKAKVNEKIMERKVGVGSSSGAWSPNGRGFAVALISPVVGSIVGL